MQSQRLHDKSDWPLLPLDPEMLEQACRAHWDSGVDHAQHGWDDLVLNDDHRVPLMRKRMNAALNAIGIEDQFRKLYAIEDGSTTFHIERRDDDSTMCGMETDALIEIGEVKVMYRSGFIGFWHSKGPSPVARRLCDCCLETLSTKER